ncbi:MAG: hypothetical protein ACSLFM_13125 [Tepidiformaceae bacterium]
MAVFTPEEIETLADGPECILMHVAGVDSSIDRDEWESLVAAVETGAAGADPIVSAVMHVALEQLREAGGPPPIHSASPLEGLRAIGALLAAKDHAGANDLREALMEIGEVVAEASGPRFVRSFLGSHGGTGWVKASKTTALEREALREAAEALGLAVPIKPGAPTQA